MLPVTILIPAYEPSATLLQLVKQLNKHVHSVLIVNDGSSDKHAQQFTEIACIEQVYYIEHSQNLGKGAALKSGMAFWSQHLNQETVGIITADADGQHAINDIIKLTQNLTEEPNHLHLGIRQFSKSIPLRSHLGNVITRSIFHILTGHKIKDTQTGLRGLPSKFIEEASSLRGTGYEYETKMLVYAIKKKWEISQQPIQTIYIEENQSSHFKPITDSFRIYSCLIKALYE